MDAEQLTNELVIRIQPNEGIYLKINNKVPGLGLRLDNSNLDLTYKNRCATPPCIPFRDPPIAEGEREYTRSRHQSQKGRGNIPVAGTNREREERIYP